MNPKQFSTKSAMKLRTRVSTYGNHLQIEQHSENRPAPTITKIQVRRVLRDDLGEHVQIELSIDTQHRKRTTSEYSSVLLSVEDVAILMTALTKLQPPVEIKNPYVGIREEMAKWREFYGLSPEKV